MSRAVEPAPVLGVCSCLAARRVLWREVEQALTATFGEIALASDPYPFDTSDYYRAEMGERLERRWYCFGMLWHAERLPQSRLATDRIEQRLAVDDRRTVNLDPGYLDLGKLVLASLKEARDKIYLGHGVWAHTCLRFDAGAFSAPDHSFPDFRDGRFDSFMLRARALYKLRLRQSQPGSA